jgi:hypothetical protein
MLSAKIRLCFFSFNFAFVIGNEFNANTFDFTDTLVDKTSLAAAAMMCGTVFLRVMDAVLFFFAGVIPGTLNTSRPIVPWRSLSAERKAIQRNEYDAPVELCLLSDPSIAIQMPSIFLKTGDKMACKNGNFTFI